MAIKQQSIDNQAPHPPAERGNEAGDILKTIGNHALRVLNRYIRDLIFALLGVAVYTALINQTETAMTWLNANIWPFMYYVFLFSLMGYGLSILLTLVSLPSEDEDKR